MSTLAAVILHVEATALTAVLKARYLPDPPDFALHPAEAQIEFTMASMFLVGTAVACSAALLFSILPWIALRPNLTVRASWLPWTVVESSSASRQEWSGTF